MGFSARMIADSVSPNGKRISTMEIEYPHAVHKDMLRHGRLRARSVMSFRALPPKKLAEMLSDENCYIPEVFNERTKGMGGGGPLPDDVQEECRRAWLNAKNTAWAMSQELEEMGVAKEQVNTLIQDYCWIKEIVTATEWYNFFALRLDLKPDGTPMARHEVFKIASMMKTEMESVDPVELSSGQWHLPLITEAELAALCHIRDRGHWPTLGAAIKEYKFVSARRCARVSFDKHTDTEPWKTSIEKAGELLANGHLTPFEHQSRPAEDDDVAAAIGWDEGVEPPVDPIEVDFMAMKGWVPTRYEIPNQDNFDLVREELRA